MKRMTKITILPVLTCLFFLLLSGGFSSVGGAADNSSEKEIIIGKTVQYLKERRINASETKLRTIAKSIYEEARRYDMDYRLVLAVMKVESNFQNEAISRRGARGLLQVKPSLAKYVARDAGVQVKGANCLHEPEKNIKIGVNYLSKLLDMFENLGSALHAYNAGPANVRKPGADDDHVTTTPFTRRVMSEYRQIIEVLPDSDEQ